VTTETGSLQYAEQQADRVR